MQSLPWVECWALHKKHALAHRRKWRNHSMQILFLCFTVHVLAIPLTILFQADMLVYCTQGRKIHTPEYFLRITSAVARRLIVVHNSVHPVYYPTRWTKLPGENYSPACPFAEELLYVLFHCSYNFNSRLKHTLVGEYLSCMKVSGGKNFLC